MGAAGEMETGSPDPEVSSLGSEHVALEQNQGVATLTLQRPHKRNAVTLLMWDAITAQVRTAAIDPEVRVLVIRGSGGYFCAGADVQTLTDQRGRVQPATLARVNGALRAIATFPVPTVAQVEGPCLGGGCGLALACDVRFSRPDATFSIPAARYGVMYDRRLSLKLLSLVGSAAATRILLASEPISGTEALRIGLVEACDERVARPVSRFVQGVLEGDAYAIRGMKALLTNGRSADLAGGW
jgi:enoyl-CoA hydratase/carnithine racemase